MDQENINLVTIILISLSFIFIGGTLYELNSNQNTKYKQPLLWPLAIGFSSAGGTIIIGLFLKHCLPYELMDQMKNIKNYKL
jgi:hypothetical protein